MNLIIDLTYCDSCGVCVDLCPGNVLDWDQMGRPLESFPENCWFCGVCEEECPSKCIELAFYSPDYI